MRRLTRRQALAVSAGVVGFIYGRPVESAAYQTPAQAQTGSRGLTINFDTVDAIVFTYKGQKQVITPAELMSALAGK